MRDLTQVQDEDGPGPHLEDSAAGFSLAYAIICWRRLRNLSLC